MAKKSLIIQCKQKLINTKRDLLIRLQEARIASQHREKLTGDEADQTLSILAEKELLSKIERIHSQLVEVEAALGRIETGKYGICEETEEPIEDARLLAIPWTRLSIEGAEIKETMKKRYAR